MLRRTVLLILLSATASAAEIRSRVQVQAVVFGEEQLLEKGSVAEGAVRRVAAKPAGTGGVGVLPFHVREYRETKPCDSCHRLSANGFEFFLENYLRGMMDSLLSLQSVRLVAPHFSLLNGEGLELMRVLDTLAFPMERWFYGYGEEIIYRESDSFSSKGLKEALDRIGGTLGMSHLLVPVGTRVKVRPQSRHRHVGGLEYDFHLVLWNVLLGRPEWAVRYREEMKRMDLDKSLKENLDRHLMTYLESLPEKARKLRLREPK